jgi:D-tyrosyl-tRNA(Tyr) deacylase
MRGVIQRVSSASVVIADRQVGEIDRGILLLLAIQKEDSQALADRLLARILAYRIFPDQQGHMNLSLADIQGGLLIVSQFTLAADTNKGLRPSFSSAANPQDAELLYDYFVKRAEESHPRVAHGVFAADMQVHLVNDGPVTFDLQVS